MGCNVLIINRLKYITTLMYNVNDFYYYYLKSQIKKQK
jgi:hypothetical protein